MPAHVLRGLRLGAAPRHRAGHPAGADHDRRRRPPAPPRSGARRAPRASSRSAIRWPSVSRWTTRPRLAAQLRALEPGLDVIDLSVPGYGTDQELLKLEREGLALAPTGRAPEFLPGQRPRRQRAARLPLRRRPSQAVLPSGGRRARACTPSTCASAATARAALWLSEHSVLFNLLSPGRAGRVLAARGGEEARACIGRRATTRSMAQPEPLLALTARLIGEMKARAGGGRAAGRREPSDPAQLRRGRAVLGERICARGWRRRACRWSAWPIATVRAALALRGPRHRRPRPPERQGPPRGRGGHPRRAGGAEPPDRVRPSSPPPE